MIRLLSFFGIIAIIILSSCQKQLSFDKVSSPDSTRLLPSIIAYNTVSRDSFKFEYDDLNRISAISVIYIDDQDKKHDYKISYFYNSDNQLIKESTPFEGDNYESVYAYSGNTITATTTWFAHNPVVKQTSTYTINNGKHLIKEDNPDGVTEYSYDSDGNQITSFFVNSGYDQSRTTHSTYTKDSAMLRCVNAPYWFLESEFLSSYIVNNVAGFTRETITEENGTKDSYLENATFTYDMNKNGFPAVIHTTINGDETTQKITYIIAK